MTKKTQLVIGYGIETSTQLSTYICAATSASTLTVCVVRRLRSRLMALQILGLLQFLLELQYLYIFLIAQRLPAHVLIHQLSTTH